MYVPYPGEVVNKDGCCPVPLFGEFSLELSNEGNICADYLINRHTFTRFCSLEIGLPSLWDSFICQGFFIIAQTRHPVHVGGLILERYLGIHPILRIKAACQMQDVQGSSATESVQLICHLFQVLLSPPLS